MKFRYPGVRSFTRHDGALFFGRKNDEERLYKLIRLEKLVMLYGRSGYGKSSLLQAAILPRLEKETDFIPITVRFYGYDKGTGKSPDPLERTVMAIEKWSTGFVSHPIDGGEWLDMLVPRENSLWYHAKKAQAATGKKQFVLIFDQFEEIFSYPEAQILQFKAQLADLLFVQIPQNFRNVFDSGNQLNDTATERFFDDVEVRALFSIRSDFMHLMNRLKDFLPQILRHSYELDALNVEQAKEAIVQPAQYVPAESAEKVWASDEWTPAFNYSPEAIKVLIDFLSKDGKEKIESFQLQLVCRHIESKFVGEQDIRLILPELFGRDTTECTKYLQDVNRNYYQECIDKLPGEQQPVARKIVENEMVTIEDKRRILADAGMLLSRYRTEGATTELLEILKDTYLLRAEATSRGLAYELSHDALVNSILDARKDRELLELRIMARKRRRRFVVTIGLSFLVTFMSLGLMIFAWIKQVQANKALEGMIAADKAREEAEKERAEEQATGLLNRALSLKDNGVNQSISGGNVSKEFTSAVELLEFALAIAPTVANGKTAIDAFPSDLERYCPATEKQALLDRIKLLREKYYK